jgi:hypothetical protein
MDLNVTIRTQDRERTRVWNTISDKLQERGLNVNFVTLSKECHQFLTKKSKKCIYLADELEKYQIKGDPRGHLARFEKKYDTSVNTIMMGDLEHSRMEREKAYTIMAKHFYFWEDYFQKNKVDFIFGGLERFVNMIPRAVAKKYGVQDAQLMSSTVIGGRSCVNTDAYGHFSLLDEYWEKNKDKEPSGEGKQRATQFIKSFRRKREQPFIWKSMPQLSTQQIKFFLDRVKVARFVEKGRYPYVDISGGTYRHVLRLIRARSAKKYYSKFDPQKKYVFYPLHVPHEAQITVVAPQYWNQVRTVENISKSLPAGYRLYVKEHPNLIGGTPLGHLKRITQLPNVKLLSPFESSLKIVEQSACVVTINSSVGWEAMLLKKPAINLGRAFYEISGLTYSIRGFHKLPETIKKAIHENPVKENVLIKFVDAIFATTFPGNILGANLGYSYYGEGPWTEEVMQEENVEKIVEGMCSQIKQIGGKSG